MSLEDVGDDAPSDAATLARRRFAARAEAVQRKVDTSERALERAMPAAVMAEVHEAFPDATAVTVEIQDGAEPGSVSVEAVEAELPGGSLAADGLGEDHQESFDAMSEKVSETVTLATSWRPDTGVGGIYHIDSSGIGSWLD